ncbi:hypothetical protein KUV64_14000 [Mameliella alba]|uniref:hypothetical protein n=1 Tax=Mameliella TaxID=1434019 RepID=UPI001C95AFA5|nr:MULTISPECIES: hypothetical protein [Mameliella]MBY6120246.1 hypothetical protein [Mameliella alba]MDD9733119.1 hypothetical protein [Mameliella sp. AT18]
MSLPKDYWLLAPTTAARKAELEDMILQAQACGNIPTSGLSTNVERRAWLQQARSAEWDRRQMSRRAAPVRRSPCEIPAREVNAWLRTLPPDTGQTP